MTYCRFLPSAAGLPFLFDVLVFSIKIRFTVLR
nr:MAG TPA: PyrBI operon leader peptide [Caudoviricetes sp.]